ncbi:uncharacterized protein A4U43_C02F17510 [Asparagus officinalis]|uniref:Uncharacterized protein n=1 Tax=Asparagus officinalis TaxID=4686 RepID=A0A5P1FMY9_ASPOF|nr:uncharacterized protein A4U43_C02F17510 [Asparagus officinalis]
MEQSSLTLETVGWPKLREETDARGVHQQRAEDVPAKLKMAMGCQFDLENLCLSESHQFSLGDLGLSEAHRFSLDDLHLSEVCQYDPCDLLIFYSKSPIDHYNHYFHDGTRHPKVTHAFDGNIPLFLEGSSQERIEAI